MLKFLLMPSKKNNKRDSLITNLLLLIAILLLALILAKNISSSYVHYQSRPVELGLIAFFFIASTITLIIEKLDYYRFNSLYIKILEITEYLFTALAIVSSILTNNNNATLVLASNNFKEGYKNSIHTSSNALQYISHAYLILAVFGSLLLINCLFCAIRDNKKDKGKK
jgi:hypothetical protein